MTQRVTRQDVEQGLRDLGLGAGDVALLHSSLSSFGFVAGGPEDVVKAFLNVLGEGGTLVVPTFGSLGVLTDVVGGDPRAVHSTHPLASVAAIGAQAKAICADHWKAETAHGHDTPYMRIADLGGYVCLAGVDQDRSTTLHTVEAMLELPYLSHRTSTFDSEEGEVTRTWRHFPGPHRDFIGLDKALREWGVMRMGKIGNAVIRLMKSKELIDACLELGRRDPAFVLCDNPNCADCVAQRAAIRRKRFENEPFTLTAAAGLAGRYVPEMIDSLRASGIRHIELDSLDGKPIQVVSAEAIHRAVQELREAECEVTSVRCSAIPESLVELAETAAREQIGRMVAPLSCAAREHANITAENGLALSVYNAVVGSAYASQMLSEFRAQGGRCGFTFNPANFARAGEKPFLESYKQRVRRFVDQLDVEDCCFDGTIQPLARGNAEIKELISILRCASFAGPMVLTSRNRSVGSLKDVVNRFVELLDAM